MFFTAKEAWRKNHGKRVYMGAKHEESFHNISSKEDEEPAQLQ